MGEKIVCFTGHRTLPVSELSAIQRALRQCVEGLIADGYVHFRTGGAVGFDTLAANAVLAAKKKNPGIFLDLILPCRDQDKGWGLFDRLAYGRILRRADSVEYVADHFNSYCMLSRDRSLVDGADLCVAFLRAETGGTAYTVQYAKSKGVPVRLLDTD